MASGKTFQVYIPGDTVEAVQRRADKVAAGNVSGYFQKLHRDEAHATGAENAERAAVALAELYNPTIARELEQLLAKGPGGRKVAQDRVVARFVEALVAALKRPTFNPESAFGLISATEEFSVLLQRRPAILRALELVAAEAAPLIKSPASDAIHAEQRRRAERKGRAGSGAKRR